MDTRPTLTLDAISLDEAGTLHGLLRQRATRTPDAIAYRQFDRQREQWRDYTWSEVQALAARWQAALAAEDLAPGDRVAVLLNNSVEWVCFDMAALSLGLVVVPLYTSDNPGNMGWILGDAGCRLLLLGTHEQWAGLASYRSQFPELQRVLCVEQGEPETGTPGTTFSTVSQWLNSEVHEFQGGVTNPDTLATIVYTSGTTGRPKGVMLSHRSILWDCDAVMKVVPAYRGDIFLSFLPLSHAFERTAGYYLAIMGGSTVAYARSVQELGEDLLSIRPTVLISVPRIYERVYARVQQGLAKKGALAQRLFQWAVAVGWRRFEASQGRARATDRLLLMFWPLLRHLVADKIISRLGGRVRLAVSGGAPLQADIARCFVGLGLPLLQGYGLTEAAPIVCGNRFENNLPTSVGVTLPGVEVRVDERGELLVRGPLVMQGYWRREEETRAVLDNDGWLHTGDLAELREQRIYIRGRLKEMLVMSTGEKISPAAVEMTLVQDPLFEQAMLVGEGKPYVAALLVLAPDAWQEFAAGLDVDARDPAALGAPRVVDAVLQRIEALLHEFPRHAQVRSVHLMLAPWTIENGLLTPTMKIKRPVLFGKYASEIEQLYAGH